MFSVSMNFGGDETNEPEASLVAGASNVAS